MTEQEREMTMHINEASAALTPYGEAGQALERALRNLNSIDEQTITEAREAIERLVAISPNAYGFQVAEPSPEQKAQFQREQDIGLRNGALQAAVSVAGAGSGDVMQLAREFYDFLRGTDG